MPQPPRPPSAPSACEYPSAATPSSSAVGRGAARSAPPAVGTTGTGIFAPRVGGVAAPSFASPAPAPPRAVVWSLSACRHCTTSTRLFCSYRSFVSKVAETPSALVARMNAEMFSSCLNIILPCRLILDTAPGCSAFASSHSTTPDWSHSAIGPSCAIPETSATHAHTSVTPSDLSFSACFSASSAVSAILSRLSHLLGPSVCSRIPQIPVPENSRFSEKLPRACPRDAVLSGTACIRRAMSSRRRFATAKDTS